MRRLLHTIRAYLELSRVSNLPTCWTNVLVGCGAGAAAYELPGIGFPWLIAALVAIAISLMYVGGMALNDACDAAIDARERPNRPIPSGRVSRRAACMYAGWCLGIGLAILTIAGMPAALLGAALAACIIAYDAMHQRFAASVILMGTCRGLIYLVAAAAVAWPMDWVAAGTIAGSMTWYVTVFSILARRETEAGPAAWGRMLGLSLLLAVLVPAAIMKVISPMNHPIEVYEWWSVALGPAVVIWILMSARHVLAAQPVAVRAVLGWLAGICLLDAFFVTLLAPRLDPVWGTLVVASLACFGLTLLGHRRILGT